MSNIHPSPLHRAFSSYPLGCQRDWVWHGWQVRYTYFRPQTVDSAVPSTPLLLIHGFGAAIGHWRKNFSVLSEHRRVYALDLLGFGASRKADVRYSIEFWADLIFDFWQTFINQPIILVGNSLGSLVCVGAAAQYPQMVQGLALINLPDLSIREEMIPKPIAPLVRAIEGFFGAPIFLKPLFQLLRQPWLIRQWARVAYPHQEAITDELIEILATPPQDEGAPQAFCRLFSSNRHPQFSPSLKAVIPSLNIPILLIWGSLDRMIPLAFSKPLLNLNPNLELVVIENAGHCPHDEVPEQFHEIILSWLASQNTPPA